MPIRKMMVLAALAGSMSTGVAAPPPLSPSCPEILGHYNLNPSTEGATVLQVTVMPSGKLASVKVICSSGNRKLDERVLNGVKQKQFPPFQGTAPRVLIIPFIVRPAAQSG